MHIALLLSSVLLTLLVFRKYHQPIQRRREAFMATYNANLERLYLLIQGKAQPDSNEEITLLALVGRTGESLQLLPLVQHMYERLRPQMDALGLFIETNGRGRRYPLLENIYPTLRKPVTGTIMTPVDGEHRVNFDFSFSVKAGQNQGAPIQPRRPLAKPLAKRLAPLTPSPVKLEFA